MNDAIVSDDIAVREDEDAPLSDLLDDLVEGRSRVADDALGVNCRRLAGCRQFRQASRRMR